MQTPSDSSRITLKLQYLLVKWEGVITAIVALCAILAILSGVVWLIARKNSLLISLLGFSACYLIGKNFWRFREEKIIPAWRADEVSLFQGHEIYTPGKNITSA